MIVQLGDFRLLFTRLAT